MGATSHLLGAGRSIDEWRGRSGRTLRFSAGDAVDAETVRRLLAEGRQIPVRLSLLNRRHRPRGRPGLTIPTRNFVRKAAAHLHWKGPEQ